MAGVIALAALIVGLIVWKEGCNQQQPPTAPTATTSSAAKTDLGPMPDFAPPPPEEEDAGAEDAGVDAGKKKKTKGSGKAPVGNSPCKGCGKGVATGALTSAVRGRAGLARGCYNRALRQGGAEGSLVVSVSVGNNGSSCGVSIVSDTMHNAAVSACVLGKFRGQAFPKPKRGCVIVNVPISFKVK